MKECSPRKREQKNRPAASVDLDFWSAPSCGHFLEPCGDRFRYAIQALCRWRRLTLRGYRLPAVATETNARVDLDLPEHGYAVLHRGLGAFTVAEDVHGLAAVWASECAHIFHHAEHLHAYLAEHFNGLADIRERDGRRSGHNNRTGHGHGLDQGQLYIARARREIDDQVVQLAPFHAAQKLRDHAMHHGTTPNDGFVSRV